MRPFSFSFFFLFAYHCLGLSQNLVKNPGFEEQSDCPVEDYMSCYDWFSVGGTTDYYHTCGTKPCCSVPENEFGHHPAHGGEAYAGLIPFDAQGYQEFLQGELQETLIKGQRYKVSFYARYGGFQACYATWCLGLKFSKRRILCNNQKLGCNQRPVYPGIDRYVYINTIYPQKMLADIENPRNNFLTDTSWVELSGYYTALGDEKYITLGAFYFFDEEFEKQTRKIIRKGVYHIQPKGTLPFVISALLKSDEKTDRKYLYSYYFIDDVSVVPVDSLNKPLLLYPELLPDTALFSNIEIGETVVLKNILFADDKWDLLPPSIQELERLLRFMQQNPTVEIEIAGHTDANADDLYNLELSGKRAKAVANYLIQRQIASQRLVCRGYGESFPLADNATEEGRALNRRVEIKILKK